MKSKAGAILSSIRINRDSDRKISVQLYIGLRDVILSGGVHGGERMPASRTLATELGVSRTTVVEALDRLISEGLLESRVGAGTFVSMDLAKVAQKKRPLKKSGQHSATPTFSGASLRASKHFASRDRLPSRTQAFITGLPALDEFPMAQWARLSARHWRIERDASLSYGETFGLPRLRSAICAHLNASRGIQCDPEQVLIVGGAQQAFSLIGDLLLEQGDKVWFENPGAIGARNAFISRGASLVPVSIDEQGLSVSDGMAKSPVFKLVFVTPSHQQPLGRVMSFARRLDLLSAAENSNALIVEDDYDGDFFYGNQPQPTLKSIDTSDRVIYVGTFSKSLFPSLRLGFILLPQSLVEMTKIIAESALSGVPTATQSIVADFMDEGHFATHIRSMRALYKQRHNALLDASRAISSHIDILPASSGFHTIGLFRQPCDEMEFVNLASQKAIILAPITKYCLSPVALNGFVIGYGATNKTEINKGVGMIADICRDIFENWTGKISRMDMIASPMSR
ncbi:MAG: PLP-dependent aminotransferase family protein [Pseudomonadota bacterium]